MQLPGEDYTSLDANLAGLFLEGRITAEEGARYAEDPAFYRNMIKGGGLGGG